MASSAFDAIDKLHGVLMYDVPREHRREFEHQLTFVNVQRARVFAVVFILFNIIWGLLPDYFFYRSGYWTGSPQYRYWAIAHGGFIAVMLALLPFLHRFRPSSVESVRPVHTLLVHLFLVTTLLLSAILTLVDQYISGTITIFILGVAAVAVIVILPNRSLLLVYGIGYFAFSALLPAVQHDAVMLFSHFVTSSEIVIIMWLASRLVYGLRARDFMNAKTIALQAAEIERANAELLKSNQELKELNKLKGDFLSIAAHDLKSPLTNIRLSSSMLLNEQLGEEERRSLYELLHSVSTQMTEKITAFLEDVSREHRGEPMTIELVDAAETGAAAIAVIRAQASEKQQRISLTAAPAAVLQTDRKALREIFDNLLSNAVKFSPTDSAIAVRIVPSGSYMKIGIEDRGPGLTAEDKLHIFGKYARLSARPTGGESSTGLGLSRVKALVDRLDGNVWTEHAEPCGTIFYVELPIRQRAQ